MAKRKQQESSNSVEQTEPEQHILSDIYNLYSQEENGLIPIAAQVGLELLPPRQKITVLLIGNHSAGKSSFINWYVEENVQRTGVAMETSGFSFITSGKRRETLTGEATIELLPHMKGLRDCAGVSDCITTEIVTSKQKRFPMITFVDTPGLIDGKNKYPYDIDNAMLWLGRMADLVFVFFDPIGQALRAHTLDVVEKMCSDERNDYKKMKFYLSKADTAGNDRERQKVITQMAKDLYGDPVNRPGMAKVGTHAEVPTIYIPKPAEDVTGPQCPNDIDLVGQLMEKQIKITVQNTLNTLKVDCNCIVEKLDKALTKDQAAATHNRYARLRGFFYIWVGLLIPFIMIVTKVMTSAKEEDLLKVVSPEVFSILFQVCGWINLIGGLVPSSYVIQSYCIVALFTFAFLFYGRHVWFLKPRLSRSQKRNFEDFKLYLIEEVATRQKALYKGYLALAVGTDHKQ